VPVQSENSACGFADLTIQQSQGFQSWSEFGLNWLASNAVTTQAIQPTESHACMTLA
jgi:hypothetical protein